MLLLLHETGVLMEVNLHSFINTLMHRRNFLFLSKLILVIDFIESKRKYLIVIHVDMCEQSLIFHMNKTHAVYL